MHFKVPAIHNNNKISFSHSTALAFTFALTWLLACWRPVSFHLPWSCGSWDSGQCLLSRASQTGWCPGPPSGCIWCVQTFQSSWPEKKNSTRLKSYFFMQFYLFHGKGLPSCYMYIKLQYAQSYCSQFFKTIYRSTNYLKLKMVLYFKNYFYRERKLPLFQKYW